MSGWLRDVFRDRPTWMNVAMVFSAYMAFVYMPWDLFWKPVAQDVEVWFGLSFEGWAAKVMALPHWFVYGAAVYGFRRRRPWMRFWGAAYSAQVAFGMFVWTVVHFGGVGGFVGGLVSAAPFLLIARAFWSAHDVFGERKESLSERYGAWAVVTGASAGIGAEFARALAGEGFSLVLTARREERLRALADELEKRFSISVRVIAVDLAEHDAPERLATAVEDLEVGMLVNNAGVGYAGRLDKQDGERLRGLVAVNCLAPTVLTNRILSGEHGMVARGRGAVIFTGSAAGRQPMPLHGVYAATKAFDLYLGEALFVELRDQNIDVLVVEPGPVATEFQEAADETSHATVQPSDVVETALASLGVQPSVLTKWFYWFRANAATRLLPRPLLAHIARGFMRSRTRREMQ
jgi:short-subunit dehydrogenase